MDIDFGIDAVSDKEIDDDNYFTASMGGEAIKELLTNLDVVSVITELLEIVNNKSTSISKKDEALKRLRILKKFDPRIEKVGLFQKMNLLQMPMF